jgi:hypothetical protein
MDIVGSFPKTIRDNVYVLVVIDQFTKWLEAYALSDQSAEKKVHTDLQRMVRLKDATGH